MTNDLNGIRFILPIVCIRDCACGTLIFKRETGSDLLTTLPSAEKRISVGRRPFRLGFWFVHAVDNFSQLIAANQSSRLVMRSHMYSRSRSTTARSWTCVECNAVNYPIRVMDETLIIFRLATNCAPDDIDNWFCALRNVCTRDAQVFLF